MDHGRPFVTWKFADHARRPQRRRRRHQPLDQLARRPALDAHRLRAAVRRDPGRHRHRRRRRPAADRARRGRRAAAAPAAPRRDGPARPARRPAGLRRPRRDARCCAPATRDEALAELFARDRPARLPRGRPDARGGVPARRAGRRGRRLRRARCCSARAPARSPTSGITTITDAVRLPVADVTTVGTGAGRATSGSRMTRADGGALMFTGIVEELGDGRRRRGPGRRRPAHRSRGPHGRSRTPRTATRSRSTACCLTVADRDRRRPFTADVMRETLDTPVARRPRARATRSTSSARSRPTTRLGGHIVQGHVDGTGTVARRTPAEHWEVVEVALPADLARYVVAEGLDHRRRHLADRRRRRAPTGSPCRLIPETLARTTLGHRQPGDPSTSRSTSSPSTSERSCSTGPSHREDRAMTSIRLDTRRARDRRHRRRQGRRRRRRRGPRERGRPHLRRQPRRPRS